ncbi:MAG: phosphoribosyL-amp cyclohydrolase phosphoribosyL-ATP pyrophosphatase [Bacillales bacterium]|jgi:phosphoribosyl-ATP pyrophosphohydrolase/phosphoribosyl-AMP cyclohydrolase|nr:phosphoribosyL-amp cyclohydrolase phosphoribosyL-ATP pyrophosphatase [Bacillales bacterium]
MIDITSVKYNSDGLVPAIVQDAKSKDVLMLAYMNEAALQETVESGFATFFSRSRGERWRKGETSGNVQKVVQISYDCDKDSILLLIEQTGVACHTGSWSCFEGVDKSSSIVNGLYDVIANRKVNPKEGSYTTYLFEKGIDKILKKVGEESSEVIIAAKNTDDEELVYEISDLVYHTLVLMVEKGITIDQIKEQLQKRER